MVEKEYYELHVDEPEEYEVEFVEAKIKPEVVGYATPTEEAQTVTPAPGTTFSAVELDAIPPEYVKPVGTKNITENATALDIAQYAEANVNVQPNLQTPNPVTPTEQRQTVEAEAGYDGLSAVIVERIPQQYIVPSGKITLTENATDIPISQYETADVIVPQPTGWIVSVDSAGAPIGGRFVPSEGKTTAGKILSYGNDNRSKSVKDVVLEEGTTVTANNAFEYCGITEIVFPLTIQSFGDYQCRNCADLEHVEFKGDCRFGYYDFMGTALKTVVCRGNVTTVNGIRTFPATTEMLDFSHCTSVPPLVNKNAFQDVVSCTIKVPKSLLEVWQVATNWCDLTGVIWEGV